MGWWSATTSRIAMLFGQSRFRSVEHTTGFHPDGSFDWLDQVAASPTMRELMLHHYSQREDGQNLEFLIVYSSFETARNPLQRFELLRNMIHNFVQPNAKRSVQLSDGRRSALLAEWDRWSHDNRVPMDSTLPALEAAVGDVQMLVAEQATA
jgi:hypothetical protein